MNGQVIFNLKDVQKAIKAGYKTVSDFKKLMNANSIVKGVNHG